MKISSDPLSIYRFIHGSLDGKPFYSSIKKIHSNIEFDLTNGSFDSREVLGGYLVDVGMVVQGRLKQDLVQIMAYLVKKNIIKV